MRPEPSARSDASKNNAQSGRFGFDIRILGPLLGLVALFVVGALINPVFLSPTNLFNVLTRSAFIGIIAVGATFVIIAGGIDLSVGSMAAFIAGVMIIVMNTAVGYVRCGRAHGLHRYFSLAAAGVAIGGSRQRIYDHQGGDRALLSLRSARSASTARS